MAITDYLRSCNYSLGSLKDYVYLVPKEGTKVLYHASDKTVNIDKIDGIIQKLECRGVTLNETQTLDSRFAFESEVNLTFDEIWMDTFHDALEYLRHNPCYIIIETTEGVQFLANIELHTKYTYDYSFTDAEDEGIYAVLTFTNTSNTPLLRVVNKIKEDEVLIGKLCDYSMCKVSHLILSPKGGIVVNDGNVTSDDQYLVEWLPDTLNYTEEYNGEYFRQTLSFSIPLDDYQDYWEYRLSEFHDNRYCAVLQTLNRNLIVLGLQNSLVPTYEIQTSESIDTPNLITITFEAYSMHSAYVTIIPTRWVDSGLFDCKDVEEFDCFRFVKSKDIIYVGQGDVYEKWNIEVAEDCVNFKQSGQYVIGDLVQKKENNFDVDLNNGEWQLMTENIPLPTQEDGTAYESIGNYHVANGRAKMRINFKNITNFKLWYRSDAQSSYDYVIVSKIDTELPSNATYSSSQVQYHTRSKQNTWYEATYPNDGESHFIEVVYLKNNTTNTEPDKGFVFIPNKQQLNDENCTWKARWVETYEEGEIKPKEEPCRTDISYTDYSYEYKEGKLYLVSILNIAENDGLLLEYKSDGTFFRVTEIDPHSSYTEKCKKGLWLDTQTYTSTYHKISALEFFFKNVKSPITIKAYPSNTDYVYLTDKSGIEKEYLLESGKWASLTFNTNDNYLKFSYDYNNRIYIFIPYTYVKNKDITKKYTEVTEYEEEWRFVEEKSYDNPRFDIDTKKGYINKTYRLYVRPKGESEWIETDVYRYEWEETDCILYLASNCGYKGTCQESSGNNWFLYDGKGERVYWIDKDKPYYIPRINTSNGEIFTLETSFDLLAFPTGAEFRDFGGSNSGGLSSVVGVTFSVTSGAFGVRERRILCDLKPSKKLIYRFVNQHHLLKIETPSTLWDYSVYPFNFENCVYLEDFDTSKLYFGNNEYISLYSTFVWCSKLKVIDLSNQGEDWRCGLYWTNGRTNYGFANCLSLETLNLSNCKEIKVDFNYNKEDYWLKNCISLKTIIAKNCPQEVIDEIKRCSSLLPQKVEVITD